MSRVLVVEDDEAMAVALKDGFTYEGHEVAVARDGEEGLHLAREEKPDIMILDVMLPKMTGLEVCKLLRGEGSDLPIIMLTARGQEIDKVLGLKLGADDYVTKPFSFSPSSSPRASSGSSATSSSTPARSCPANSFSTRYGATTPSPSPAPSTPTSPSCGRRSRTTPRIRSI